MNTEDDERNKRPTVNHAEDLSRRRIKTFVYCHLLIVFRDTFVLVDEAADIQRTPLTISCIKYRARRV
ncbi:hypothetical protein GWI33_004265 [Rhynchophorus ferrugineus]|uniref:Uncharacterized protein n=1 Tax=Rhynchophorus ferrugineus TaxID=354439 RepID=A0A834IQC7_RHYFE|nr:hypothetical protein GWI33_004265 [Rhynchophorus ferrugineus]